MRLVFLFIVTLAMSAAALGQAPAADQAAQNPPAAENASQPSSAATTAPPETSAAPQTDSSPQEKKPDTTVPDTSAPNASTPSTPAPNASSPNVVTPKTGAKRRKRPAPIPGQPQKIVVREGGASEPAAQIAPDMTPEEALRQRKSAEKLLEGIDDKLRELDAHTLNAQQQETVAQIKNYMTGARLALKAGDVHRAGTLAEKGSELAQDLLRH